MPAGQCNDARPVGRKAVSGARRGAEPGSARRERLAGQGSESVLSVSWRVAERLYAGGTVQRRTARRQEGGQRREAGRGAGLRRRERLAGQGSESG